jgi:YfiH family protein
MGWIEERRGGILVMRPADAPEGLVVAFSGRGHAPGGEATPTPVLARRLSAALGLDGMPIRWARQVHGSAAVVVRENDGPGEARDSGECDVLATDRADLALVVQSADCVPILLAGSGAVAAAHAGWRGTAKNVAAAAVEALSGLGATPGLARAWLGPSIGPCCYEVGGEVASRFAGEFVRAGCGGPYRLDLAAVNVAQLEAAGIRRESIVVHPACTRCGGEAFASYRRDGARAGRMIAMVARRAGGTAPRT